MNCLVFKFGPRSKKNLHSKWFLDLQKARHFQKLFPFFSWPTHSDMTMLLLHKSATLLLQFQTEDKAAIGNFFVSTASEWAIRRRLFVGSYLPVRWWISMLMLTIGSFMVLYGADSDHVAMYVSLDNELIMSWWLILANVRSYWAGLYFQYRWTANKEVRRCWSLRTPNSALISIFHLFEVRSKETTISCKNI